MQFSSLSLPHSHTFCSTPTQRHKLFSPFDYTHWELHICAAMRERGRQLVKERNRDGKKKKYSAERYSYVFPIASSEGTAEKKTHIFPKVLFPDALEQMLFSKHEQVN